MPAATFNRERTVGTQLPGATRTSQGFQDAIIEESQVPSGQLFGLVDGTAQANLNNLIMDIEIERAQNIDLSGFSRASQGTNGPNCNIPTTATAGAPSSINQTQLLSGSRSSS